MNLKPEVIASLYHHVEAWYQRLSQSESSSVIMNYAGDLGPGFSGALSARLELMLDAKFNKRQATKRFFSVFVEAIQNIHIHGVSDETGRVHAGAIVYELESKICAMLFNVVSKAQAKMLSRRYDEINSLTADELKQKYLGILKAGELSEKGGAGLGIITIVMRSKLPSTYQVIPLNDTHSIFQSTISVSLI